MKRKLRMGMIGGGPGAFIGEVHRMAANLDGIIELVCGSFSSKMEKSLQTGEALFLPKDRIYATYQEMIEKENQLPKGERMDFVSIVTPNHLHFEPAKLALENGFHVILDKPMTLSLEEAEILKKLVNDNNLQLCLTHTYTGYPMIKEAKHMVNSGELGEVKKVYVEYPQGWLSTPEENNGNKQAEWRSDPAKSGIAGSMGDVGTHAANLIEYISGLKITKVCADINTIVPNRALDDDGAALLKLNNGASGVLFVSQVATGEENCLKIRLYGDKAGIEWKHDDANSLIIKKNEEPTKILRTGGPGTSSIVAHNQRIPAGHPEGFIEAFANLYRNFALTVDAQMNGQQPKEEWLDFTNVEDGVRGMLFLEKVIASGKSEQKWISL
ncbi:MAG TPA: Gfo/Idh/MocA family oxidoreductase [Chitinophagaceae bacterium]|nr:Gfo/Idh/MocA family oxidoreductase [Chitinophagaceae bacterium]